MFVKNLRNCKEFIAGDNTKLRELLHPENDGIDLAYSLAYAKLGVGQKSLPHRLKTSLEVYFILNGQGIVYIDREPKRVGRGDAVYIPANSIQYISNSGKEELGFLCIVSPPWHKEDEEVIQ